MCSIKSTTAVTLGVNIEYYIQYMFVQWFQNGVAVSDSHESSFYPIKYPQAKLTIQNPIPIHIGVYEVQLRVGTSRVTCNNPSSYTRFMGTSTAVTGTNTQKLLYSGNEYFELYQIRVMLFIHCSHAETPFTEVTAESSSLPATHTTLTCTATGGYPPVDSITLCTLQSCWLWRG